MHPIAYLRCEMKARDLKSRLLIAAHLLRRGYPVVIGQFWAMNGNLGTMPTGCVLFATANEIQGANVRIFREIGNATVVCDEEAISTAESLITHTTSENAIKHCNAYLAMNAVHARAIAAKYPEYAAKVTVAGTPRTDILRSLKPVTSPYPRPYTLINTAFGLINSVWATQKQAVEIYAAGMGWDLANPEHAGVMESRLEYERLAMVETRKLIDHLCASGREVVLRPHPAENRYFWMNQPGIHVVSESDPHPWLKNADIVIHSDSTIGIEAALMGAPTLNLSPLDAWADRVNLRAFNQTVKTAQEAMAAINRGLTASPPPDELCPRGAAEKLAETMVGLMPPPEPINGIRWNPTHRFDVQRTKFTVEIPEFMEAAKGAFDGVCGDVQGIVLDDSLYLLRPNS